MTEIHRILCPIDFSDASRHALEHAVALARWYESEITALHVLPVPLLPEPPILLAFAQTNNTELSNAEAAEALLQSWLEAARQGGIKVHSTIVKGNPASLILQHANTSRADLIAMGTHGLSGFDRALLGSVTEKVLRKAKTPVLTVPPAAATTGQVPYKRLLCPVDFSESSIAALNMAFSLAKEADAALTLLHVFEWPPDDEPLVQRFDVAAYRRVVEDEVRSRLRALITSDVQTWCKPSTKFAHGKPYRAILETARSEATDLIVIGVRGRNPLDLMLFGSTTNQVIRHASCPVLTLTRPGSD
jgi:nucleotide-binding universal stress UspA family protein